MKKAISLLLAFVLCLSLCACDSSDNTLNTDISNTVQTSGVTTNPTEETLEIPSEESAITTEETLEIPSEESAITTEDILENAVLIDALKFYEEANSNIIRVESEYDGKSVLFRDKIAEIQRDYIIVGENTTQIKAYLATEDIVKLNKDEYVLIAGIISNITLDPTIQFFSTPHVSMDMQQGYLVQNPETDNAPLYNNAKRLLSEANYADALFILKHLNGYSNSNELLLEAVCKAAFEVVEGRTAWKTLFMNSNPVPLTGEEIKEIIVGDWYSNVYNKFSTYHENGEFYLDGDTTDAPVWFVENDRLVINYTYSKSEKVIYHFYKNAYVFCSPRAYNRVTDDVYELRFLNGALE